MRIIMTIVVKACFAVSLLLLLAVVASSQNVSEEFCRQIKNSVIRKLDPTSIRTEDTYDNECVFEFRVGAGVDVNLDVEKLNTEKASHESVDRFLLLLAVGQRLESEKELPFCKLDTNERWDEVYFVRTTMTNCGVLLLRKGRVRITILSAKEELLIQIERLLRDHPDLKRLFIADSAHTASPAPRRP
jgi:hypothetical protein